jgi:hypothetical protein
MLRRLILCATVVAILGSATAVDAAFTTSKCLAAKRKVWIALRKCQAAEQVKAIAVKPTDLVKCTTKFQASLAKIDAKAAKAAIACRYRDNGDSTVTDFDTGLMWERKIETIPFMNLPCEVLNGPSCVSRQFTWLEAMGEFLTELNGHFANDGSPQAGHAGYADWRLPTFDELFSILDLAVPGCNQFGVCIDPTFGPTNEGSYWSSSTIEGAAAAAWRADFAEGDVGTSDKGFSLSARAVRTGL